MLQNGAQKAACFALTVTILLICSISGTWIAVTAAILIGASAPFFARCFDLQPKRWWPLPLFLALASGLVTSVTYAFRPFAGMLWGIPALIFLVSLSSGAIARMTQNRCNLCHRRLGPQEVTFTCPRCGLIVCDENCWSFDHRRCRLCEENGVPILPSVSQWWDRQLGPRVQQGRCQVCLASPEQADLRLCTHCRRPQCRTCWDHTNGECSRCGWVLPELPEPLKEIAVHLPLQGKE
jgi:hypothetical protein